MGDEDTYLQCITDTGGDDTLKLYVNGVNTVNNTDTTTIFEHGEMCIKEITTPTAKPDYGKIYTKADNKLYFQDGAGNEHEVGFV